MGYEGKENLDLVYILSSCPCCNERLRGGYMEIRASKIKEYHDRNMKACADGNELDVIRCVCCRIELNHKFYSHYSPTNRRHVGVPNQAWIDAHTVTDTKNRTKVLHGSRVRHVAQEDAIQVPIIHEEQMRFGNWEYTELYTVTEAHADYSKKDGWRYKLRTNDLLSIKKGDVFYFTVLESRDFYPARVVATLGTWTEYEPLTCGVTVAPGCGVYCKPVKETRGTGEGKENLGFPDEIEIKTGKGYGRLIKGVKELKNMFIHHDLVEGFKLKAMTPNPAIDCDTQWLLPNNFYPGVEFDPDQAGYIAPPESIPYPKVTVNGFGLKRRTTPNITMEEFLRKCEVQLRGYLFEGFNEVANKQTAVVGGRSYPGINSIWDFGFRSVLRCAMSQKQWKAFKSFGWADIYSKVMSNTAESWVESKGIRLEEVRLSELAKSSDGDSMIIAKMGNKSVELIKCNAGWLTTEEKTLFLNRLLNSCVRGCADLFRKAYRWKHFLGPELYREWVTTVQVWPVWGWG